MDDRCIVEALREATDTTDVVIGNDALDSVADVFERSFGERAAVVIADENTFEVAGMTVSRNVAHIRHRRCARRVGTGHREHVRARAGRLRPRPSLRGFCCATE